MNNINDIFNVLSFMYKKTLKNNKSEYDKKELKNLLIKNNLLTEYYSKNIETQKNLDINYFNELKSKISNLKNSIEICQRLLNNFLIFKTFRGEGFIRVPNDLDIIIDENSYENCKEKFFKEGFILKDEILEEGSYGLYKENFLKIHVHTEISWCEKKFVSNEFLFSNKQKVKFHDKIIEIPSKESEFLITLAHGNFEPMHLMISEIVYLYSMINDINFDVILKEAKKNNWFKTLGRNLGALNCLHQKIYGDKINVLNQFNTKFEDVFLNYNAPFTYNRLHLIKSVFETKIFSYVFKRLPKVIKHSFYMNTFNYIDPPEKQN